ncbi:MAG: HEPN domain-containing protein [Bacteroidota bacterium]|nr:HEPN domain-containing protein [Bacteroidota bacterium]
MININKQIEYWTKGANDDLLTAELLIREKRILHGLFFCHLVIEKAIKAHVVETSGEVAPRSHNLIYLSEKTDLVFDNETEIFMGILMKYQLQGRYPDYDPVLPDIFKVNEYFEKTRTLLQWLKEKL